MTKDFSWKRSASDYNRMYEKIIDYTGTAELTFEEAFETLKEAYIEVDRINRTAHPDVVDPNYHRIFQITMSGRAEGTLYVEFKEGQMNVQPYAYEGADAYIDCSYDNLLAMARGEKKTDVLFLTGKLKITGSLSRGYELRNVLAPFSELGLKIHEIRKMAKLIDLKRENKDEGKVQEETVQPVNEIPENEYTEAWIEDSAQNEAEEPVREDALLTYEERDQKKEDFKQAALELKKKGRRASGGSK